MLASLLVVFREVLEAGLIVGIVLAATEGIRGRGVWISAGVGGGVLGACIVAAFAGALGSAFEGVGQELFTASILSLAVLMLSWHILWMSKHGRELAETMNATGRAVRGGEKSLLALALVVGVAVLREGSEIVLFLYGIVVATKEGPAPLVTGGVLGIGLGAILSYAIYRGLVAIPMRHLFSTTNWLIALLAAGMAGQAAATLASADLIPSLGERLWDTSWLLSDDGLAGRALHALVGYSAQPSGVQIAAYLATLIVLIISSHQIGQAGLARRRSVRGPAEVR
jgi:high-affinity iron transporter